MKDLIEALTILMKYKDEKYPTHCEHDLLSVGVFETKDIVSKEDQARLEELDFFWAEDVNGAPGWGSYRFGKA